MKRITIQRRTGPTDYLVYENEEEFKAAGLQERGIEEAQPGDYVKSDNGFYVPVVNIYDFPVKNNAKTKVRRVYFPRQDQIIHIYKSTGDKQQSSFIYDVFCKHGPRKPVRLTARMRLMLNYLEAGWDLIDAFKASYNIKGTSRSMQYLGEILTNEKVVEYIRKSKKMNELKEGFKKEGVTSQWLAKQCKKIVEDKNTAAALRIKALDTAKDVLSLRDDNMKGKEEVKIEDVKLKLAKDLKSEIAS